MNLQNLTKWMRRLGATLIFLLLAINQVHAIPVTIPTELNPGDLYRLVFVTSDNIFGTSDDIAVYNDFVDTIANSVPELKALGTKWTAIASTAAVDARDNTLTDPATGGPPVYNMRDEKLAGDYGDMWDGDLLHPVAYDERGILVTADLIVWTGTNTDGRGYTSIELGNIFNAFAAGLTNQNDDQWVTWGVDHKSFEHPMYGISGVLTAPDAPVPEPATILLISSGLVALAGCRRKSRKA